VRSTRIQAKSDKVRDGVIQCNDCRCQYTVTVGTVMQGAHITLRQWVQAFCSICAHKRGVSAAQLQRDLGLHSYQSAWHMAHRIRLALKEDAVASLGGMMEVDETYVGGKPRKGERSELGNPVKHKRRLSTKKTPMAAPIERDGRAQVVDRVNAGNLKSTIRENLNRFSFRWSGRKVADGDRAILTVQGAEGKRLAYRQTARAN